MFNINVDVRKYVIYFICFTVSLFILNWLLLKLKFVQSDSDKYFEKKLYSSLIEKKPVMVSDINSSDWDEVCILYIDQYPEDGMIIEKYSRQLRNKFYLRREFDFLPFLEKFEWPTWWMFFVNSSGDITELYRLGVKSVPSFYLGNDGDRNEYNYYVSMLGKDGFRLIYPERCQKRNNAFFMQTEFYNTRKGFLPVSKIR